MGTLRKQVPDVNSLEAPGGPQNAAKNADAQATSVRTRAFATCSYHPKPPRHLSTAAHHHCAHEHTHTPHRATQKRCMCAICQEDVLFEAKGKLRPQALPCMHILHYQCNVTRNRRTILSLSFTAQSRLFFCGMYCPLCVVLDVCPPHTQA